MQKFLKHVFGAFGRPPDYKFAHTNGINDSFLLYYFKTCNLVFCSTLNKKPACVLVLQNIQTKQLYGPNLDTKF